MIFGICCQQIKREKILFDHVDEDKVCYGNCTKRETMLTSICEDIWSLKQNQVLGQHARIHRERAKPPESNSSNVPTLRWLDKYKTLRSSWLIGISFKSAQKLVSKTL